MGRKKLQPHFLPHLSEYKERACAWTETIQNNIIFRMKPIVIIIFFALTAFSSFAQRLNEHGLKMVSEIEYSDKLGGGSCHLTFKYDDHDRLAQMSVYQDGKLYRDFIKTSDGLAVKDYDDYNYSPLRWEVAFDCYGNISKIFEYEEFEPGAIKRDEYQFFYERDGIGNPFRLSRYSHTETSKRKGQKAWYGTTVGTLYTEIFYKDGFIKAGYPQYFKRYAENINYEHINDTHINLLRLCNFDGFYFTLTEWLPCRSKYFEKDHFMDSSENLYQYDYDAHGNLVEIRYIPDVLRKKITIKYLFIRIERERSGCQFGDMANYS